MIQTGEARNNGNAIQIDIELLVDTSSPDLLSITLDAIPLQKHKKRKLAILFSFWSVFILTRYCDIVTMKQYYL